MYVKQKCLIFVQVNHINIFILSILCYTISIWFQSQRAVFCLLFGRYFITFPPPGQLSLGQVRLNRETKQHRRFKIPRVTASQSQGLPQRLGIKKQQTERGYKFKNFDTKNGLNHCLQSTRSNPLFDKKLKIIRNLVFFCY